MLRYLRYDLRGDRYSSTDALEVKRSRAFLNLAASRGAQALREGGRSIDSHLRDLEGFDTVSLERLGLSVVVVPALGGRLLSFRQEGGTEDWMNRALPRDPDYPCAGGYEEYSRATWRSPGWNQRFECVAGPSSLELSADIGEGLRLDRVYRIEPAERGGGTLAIESSLINTGNQPRDVTFRGHPEFATAQWDHTHLLLLQPDGTWERIQPWRESQLLEGGAWLENQRVPSGSWVLVRGGDRLLMTFDRNAIDKLLVSWARPYCVLAETFCPTRTLAPGERFTFAQRWTPTLRG